MNSYSTKDEGSDMHPTFCFFFGHALHFLHSWNFWTTDLIQSMDLAQELDRLQKQRALGPPRHKKQVGFTLKSVVISYWKLPQQLKATQFNKYGLF